MTWRPVPSVHKVVFLQSARLIGLGGTKRTIDHIADRKKSHILSLAGINTQVEQALFHYLMDLSLHFDKQADTLEEESQEYFAECAHIARRAMDRVRDVESRGVDEDEEPKQKKARTNIN